MCLTLFFFFLKLRTISTSALSLQFGRQHNFFYNKKHLYSNPGSITFFGKVISPLKSQFPQPWNGINHYPVREMRYRFVYIKLLIMHLAHSEPSVKVLWTFCRMFCCLWLISCFVFWANLPVGESLWKLGPRFPLQTQRGPVLSYCHTLAIWPDLPGSELWCDN